MNDVPLVSVIVVSYNVRRYLEKCLESIFRQTYPRFEVWVVDNASSDGSLSLIRDRFPEVKLIENERNVGFAAAVNQAAACAEGELVALLNPDAVASEDWLRNLVEAIRTKHVAQVAATVETQVRSGKTSSGGSSLNILGYHVPGFFQDSDVTFFASGCSFMYHKDQIDIPFDADYFAYYEDVLLSWRLRLAGWTIKRVPEAKVWHRGGGSWSDDLRFQQWYYSERNRLLALLTCYSGQTLLKIAPLLGLDILWSLVSNWPKNLLGHGRPAGAFLMAYGWLLRNYALIRQKRQSVQAERQVGDDAIIYYQTCKLCQDGGMLGRLLNWGVGQYCSLVGLRTWELSARRQ